MRQGESGEERQSDLKVSVEAYLFDTWLWYEGKRTSMRLELFVTDSIIGAGGRSYLGKGALKGWIRSDSLRIYFPQSDEFVSEPLRDLLNSVACTERSPELQLLELFYSRPDHLTLDTLMKLSVDSSDADRPVFALGMENCPWQISVEYDRRQPGFRIREFEFDNGDNLRIEARRREYRDETDVQAGKFRLTIPDGAVQIIP